jgi:hypothetical protein
MVLDGADSMEWKEMTWKGDDMDRYGTGFTTNEQGMT